MNALTSPLDLRLFDPAADLAPRPQATSESNALDFTTIDDLSALEAIGAEWSELFELAGRPSQVFQTHAWLRIWARLYVGRETHLAIITGRREGRLALVWPLAVRRIFGLRILVNMGEPVSQYCDAVVAGDVGETEIEAALDYAMGLRIDAVALRRVRDDAAIAAVLRRRLGLPLNPQSSPIVDLSGLSDAAAFERRFDGKLRSSRRRRRRRLEERGPVSFATFPPSAEAADLAATALRFKVAWAKTHGIVAPAIHDPRFAAFFVKAASASDSATPLRVAVLRCADEIMGIAISVTCKGQSFGHVLAPRPGYDQLGLGGLLAEGAILDALAEGHSAMDLLAPADRYKMEWASRTIGIGDYTAAYSMLGRLYTRCWIGGGRERMKRLAKWARPFFFRLQPRGRGSRS